MSGFQSQDDYWTNQPQFNNYNYASQDSNPGFHSELNFQDTSQYENVPNDRGYDQWQSNYYVGNNYGPQDGFKAGTDTEFEDEPPLLEELGIDPDRIMQKTLAVLNPFHKQGLVDDASFLTKDTDLAGPLVFCLALGATLVVSGGKANFGYIYGLVVTGCLLMYSLLSLMNTSGTVTLTSVASILGYCLLPIVGLSVLSIFLTMTSLTGIALSILGVSWCSLSASRLFMALMASDCSQRPLIAYPCLPPDPNQINQPILVCTAHIHWDPEFCDVKLIQTMMLSYELKSILEEASHNFRPGHKPDTNCVQLLLCGDFNSLPDSGVIEFLSSGRVSADHPDFKELQYKSVLQKISGCEKPNEFTHSFKLASAYSEDIMPFTNYTFDFKGIIDYIFYSKQSMTPLGLLGPVNADWLKENKVVGCPHPHVPSDHFPLLVELEMCPTVPGTTNGLITRR
ncbi:hypothetical protein RUM43_003458 [Polyplax serrata]|uniref:Endonuclease/exonuclease/phosphatase domain-containing protein n=1 Tax=Polyplax serrata TaxID=468196 RepID=A0AAN8P2C2_POLSC